MTSSLAPLLSAISGLPGLADIPRHRDSSDVVDIVAPTGLRAPAVAIVGGESAGAAPRLVITSTAREADDEMLVNSLAMLLPFAPEEKQALLEAESLADRREMLDGLLEYALHGGDEEETVH